MPLIRRYDLIIIGMGSGGLVAAEFAATLDLKVCAVERHRIGGDCLWTGCVPSKALLASAKAAHTMRHADRYGIEPVEPTIDTARVWTRIKAIQQQIADAEDNAEHYRAMGCEVLLGDATLTSPKTVMVGDELLEARFVLLATGSRPVVPPIEGLAEAGFLSSETVFEADRAPSSAVFIGAGPISIELAQAFARLGVPATVLEQGDRILPRDEPELVARLQERLLAEGVDLQLGVGIERVALEDGQKVVHGTRHGTPGRWAAAEIVLGAGRRPNIEDLGLEALGVEVAPRGVVVDDRSRTNVPSVYAVGDLTGRHLFTHAAGYQAAQAVRDMFFPGKGRADALVPWCTFTDPELAHVGMTIAEARERHDPDDVQVFRAPLDHSDRARADGAEAGEIVIVTAKRRVVGAHALAPAAGELVHELALAIHEELRLSDLASMIHVYPTLSIETQKLAKDAAYETAEKYSWLVRRTK